MTDFQEAIITDVLIPNSETASRLEIVINGNLDVIEFWLDGKLLFSGDWAGNLKEFFAKALDKWK
jgi:hypothetical protein